MDEDAKRRIRRTSTVLISMSDAELSAVVWDLGGRDAARLDRVFKNPGLRRMLERQKDEQILGKI